MPVCVCVCGWVATWRWVGHVVIRLFTKFGRELSGDVLPVSGRLGATLGVR